MYRMFVCLYWDRGGKSTPTTDHQLNQQSTAATDTPSARAISRCSFCLGRKTCRLSALQAAICSTLKLNLAGEPFRSPQPPPPHPTPPRRSGQWTQSLISRPEKSAICLGEVQVRIAVAIKHRDWPRLVWSSAGWWEEKTSADSEWVCLILLSSFT